MGSGHSRSSARAFLTEGPRRVSPFFVPMFIPDIASGVVAIRLGAKGPNYCTVSACASSAHAIGEAFRLVQSGAADVMIAGGAEAAITPLAIAGFTNMKALSMRNDEPERASRPFDKAPRWLRHGGRRWNCGAGIPGGGPRAGRPHLL